MSEPLLVTLNGAVKIISINSPPWNLMSMAFIDYLEQEVERIKNDEKIRAVVLTAQGDKNFSAGMNLKQLPSCIEKMGSARAVFDQRLRVIRSIETMGKPWVATLFGYCLGGGLELPLGCHFRLAAQEGAQIGLPEMDLGVVPAWGGSARLTKLIGQHHAIDMILRAKKISGTEAHRIGLVHEVWPLKDLKAAAINLAQELAAQPAGAIRSMLHVIIDGQEKPIEELIEAEKIAVATNRESDDAREGRAAFLEKRAPVFNKKTK